MENNPYKISLCVEITEGKLFINGKQEFLCPSISFDDALNSINKKYVIVHQRYGKMDRLARLGYTTTELLIGIQPINKYSDSDVGIILSNHSSSIDTDLKYNETTNTIPSPSLFVYTLPNIVLAEICIKNKLKGENLFLVSDTFNTTEIYNIIIEMLNNNRAKACIAGWVEVFEHNYRSVAFLVEKNDNEMSKNELTIKNIDNCFIK